MAPSKPLVYTRLLSTQTGNTPLLGKTTQQYRKKAKNNLRDKTADLHGNSAIGQKIF
ncbi:MAG TPA: hypothetical protein IAA88_09110 [Candidatus Avimuribaculum pullicola]|nr:hypothetical protein [Candidatus Avimuribaculum pullicola]